MTSMHSKNPFFFRILSFNEFAFISIGVNLCGKHLIEIEIERMRWRDERDRKIYRDRCKIVCNKQITLTSFSPRGFSRISVDNQFRAWKWKWWPYVCVDEWMNKWNCICGVYFFLMCSYCNKICSFLVDLNSEGSKYAENEITEIHSHTISNEFYLPDALNRRILCRLCWVIVDINSFHRWMNWRRSALLNMVLDFRPMINCQCINRRCWSSWMEHEMCAPNLQRIPEMHRPISPDQSGDSIDFSFQHRWALHHKTASVCKEQWMKKEKIYEIKKYFV